MNDPKTIDPTDTVKPGAKTPLHQEENLEAGLEDSMDASDPPSSTAPGDHGDPVPSSGFHEEEDEDKDAPDKP